MIRTRKGDDAALSRDREAALRLTPVSRETLARLDKFVELLLTWQPKLNLIAPSTLPRIWTRHVADSLQLLPLAPDARVWIDLGAGAGFPGLAVACALSDHPGRVVHLVESDSRKAAFLREVIRTLRLPAQVHAERIETLAKKWPSRTDVVTARALAPLPRLLEYAAPFLERGAQGLFPKGQDVEAELTEAAKCWHMVVELLPSVTSPSSRIVRVRHAERTRNRSGP